jgi:hypothetical protein
MLWGVRTFQTEYARKGQGGQEMAGSRWFRAAIAGVLSAGLAIAALSAVSGQVPRKINYQGRLTDGEGLPAAGPHTVVFRIFSDAVGGTALWAETQSVTADTAGVFTAILGEQDSIDVVFEEPRWLEVEVDGEVLTPRREMVSVPFAFQAANSQALAGLEADAFADSAHTHHSLSAADGDPAIALYVDDSGNVGVATQTPQAELDVAGTTRTTGFTMPTGAAAGRVLTSDAGGAGTWQIPESNPDGDWIISGDDMFAAVSGKVSIGNPSPSGRFEVQDATNTDYVTAIHGKVTSSTAQGSNGVVGETYSNGTTVYGAGVVGVSRATEGSGVGVFGGTSGPTGRAVVGAATSPSGQNYGVYGKTVSPNGYAGYFEGVRSYFSGSVGIGVLTPEHKLQVADGSPSQGTIAIYGAATSTAAKNSRGVVGETLCSDTVAVGSGVMGSAKGSGSYSWGVLGVAEGSRGSAVMGIAEHATGENVAINGATFSTNGYGCYIYGPRNYFSGKLGIGIKTPQELLHLNGGASGETGLRITNSNTGMGIADGLSLRISADGTGRLFNMENKAFEIATGGVKRMTIRPRGGVSIGTQDSLGTVTISDSRASLALNSTYMGPHPSVGLELYHLGAYVCGMQWDAYHNMITVGSYSPIYIDPTTGWLGAGAEEPANMLDVRGAGTTWGGVNGYNEVMGHFTNTGSGHTAVAIDAAESNLDAILYLGQGGKAFWDLRCDGDDAKKFQLRYQGPAYRNWKHVTVDTLGNVAIGTTNPGGYKLYVAGAAYSTGGWNPSDARLKEKIAPIEGALSSVLALRGISFEWRRNEFPDMGLPEGRHYGFVAQDVERVLPEVVKEGPGGDKAVAYNEIIPVLVESLRELNAENESLKQRIEALEVAQGLK